ncbi:DUF6083 domain-containing protein [Streptomyces sp. NPDC001674]|uniref:DUF6083 domain-containing protein n=1 Tax=unclassified Streptomyces TaxID=2593676 RepID=UPI00331974E8
MGDYQDEPRRLATGQPQCTYCGLPVDRVATADHDWVLLEPDVAPPAHVVPAPHRWIPQSDGRVTVYGVCPPDPAQRCRVEHRLACAAQPLPDLWPWLTALRTENGRRAQRRTEPARDWPDAG